LVVFVVLFVDVCFIEHSKDEYCLIVVWCIFYCFGWGFGLVLGCGFWIWLVSFVVLVVLVVFVCVGFRVGF